ncbi:MAG: hypothetical protein JW937_00975 [Candidatus Omnitrophica bacterium]|nr:hypothetical protein [Candidatus Omnitrophota bacterium]
MRHGFRGIAFWVLGLGIAATAVAQVEPVKDLHTALKDMAMAREALELESGVLEPDPDSIDSWVELAVAHAEAIKDATMAVELQAYEGKNTFRSSMRIETSVRRQWELLSQFADEFLGEAEYNRVSADLFTARMLPEIALERLQQIKQGSPVSLEVDIWQRARVPEGSVGFAGGLNIQSTGTYQPGTGLSKEVGGIGVKIDQ